jgi:hypothetical protein
MALKLLQPGCQPLGQFDGLDTEVLTLKGGEVVTLVSSVVPPGDKAAADSFDGYTNPAGTQKRPVVTKTLDAYARPLMLADEGVSGYGTLFGTVVGGTVGQTTYGVGSTVPASALLGPHTATGSGKVTCWEKPGLYAVSLDACDTTVSTGLQPTNTTIDTGKPLYYTTAGLLTPNAAAAPLGLGGAQVVVGRFVDFETNGSLVTTPNRLVAALNSPSGLISSVGPRQFAFATFYFNPPAA